jgi:predicted RNA-binding protein
LDDDLPLEQTTKLLNGIKIIKTLHQDLYDGILEEYEYDIEYTKGKDNTAADALSRKHCTTNEPVTLTNEELNAQLDSEYDILFEYELWIGSSEKPKYLKICPND